MATKLNTCKLSTSIFKLKITQKLTGGRVARENESEAELRVSMYVGEHVAHRLDHVARRVAQAELVDRRQDRESKRAAAQEVDGGRLRERAPADAPALRVHRAKQNGGDHEREVEVIHLW